MKHFIKHKRILSFFFFSKNGHKMDLYPAMGGPVFYVGLKF